MAGELADADAAEAAGPGEGLGAVVLADWTDWTDGADGADRVAVGDVDGALPWTATGAAELLPEVVTPGAEVAVAGVDCVPPDDA